MRTAPPLFNTGSVRADRIGVAVRIADHRAAVADRAGQQQAGKVRGRHLAER